jgi:hypothetical protein
MKTIDTTGWTWEPGSLDEWNAEPEHHFRIIQKGEVFAGSHHDGPRMAVSNAGTVVAIELEGLNTYCLVHPEALRLA